CADILSLLSCYGDPRHLPSFPTRRSSDLLADVAACPATRRQPAAAPAEPRRAALPDEPPGTLRITEPLDGPAPAARERGELAGRSEEHTSELQSRENLVCRLLLEKKKTQQ